MQKNEIAVELKNRIERDIKFFKGNLPERYALAWHGYVAGLYEWDVIDLESYGQLVDILPKTSSPDPIVEIFEGRDDEE